MRRSTRPSRWALAVVTALMAAAAGPASAQGTAEQREACAPDAITLCQDTIPDVTKTEACMKAHFAQLSPKCKAEFSAATAEPPAASPAPNSPAPAASAALPPPGPANDALAGYRAYVESNCRQGLIDPYTCKTTFQVLDSMK